MSSGRRNTEKQATILRKNLLEWDRMLRTPRGEDWSTMLGRLNAAQSNGQHGSGIEDLMEHLFTYPQSTANAQDVHFSLDAARNSQRGNGARSRWH
jgi:hypothetical protein